MQVTANVHIVYEKIETENDDIYKENFSEKELEDIKQNAMKYGYSFTIGLEWLIIYHPEGNRKYKVSLKNASLI